MTNWGEIARQVREAKGLTVMQLAERLDIDRDSVLRLEAGTGLPRQLYLNRLARMAQQAGLGVIDTTPPPAPSGASAAPLNGNGRGAVRAAVVELADGTPWGERVRTLRKSRGLKQSEFGALLGVANTTVCNWEKGHSTPPRHQQEAYLAVLGEQVATMPAPATPAVATPPPACRSTGVLEAIRRSIADVRLRLDAIERCLGELSV